jgi:CheY-like chemotaxis protein
MTAHVLVLEADHDKFGLIERSLGGDFVLMRAASLPEALQLVGSLEFDLIVMDVHLPDQAGLTALEAMRAAAPRTPIILITTMHAPRLVLPPVPGDAPRSEVPSDRLARDAVQRLRSETATHGTEPTDHSRFDSVRGHIAILDERGTILSVNEAWRRFGQANGLNEADFCVGTNYLEVCEKAQAATGLAHDAAEGIRAVMSGTRMEFFLEYPCHSPSEPRWFVMRVSPVDGAGPARVMVCHERILPAGKRAD